MEAVWLSGSEYELRDGRGCLSFEVKGEPGSRGVPTRPPNSVQASRSPGREHRGGPRS